jgi:Mn2+/Fe2+ NRAMP family transporter
MRADSPNLPLMKVILVSQVANGVLIPFALIFMLVLINRRDLMGEMRNRSWQNIVAGSTSNAMIALTAMMLWTSTRG